MITVLAKLTALSGKESLLAEECMALAKDTRANEKGCLMYVPYVSSENPAEIFVFAQYVDQEALEVHKQAPHFIIRKAKLSQLIDEKNTDILDGELLQQILKELI